MSKRERIEALEARVAALEARNTPGGLEGAPDNTPGGECWSCDATTRPCADPEPVPQWRVLVDSWAENGVMDAEEDPLAAVLWSLHRISLLQGVDKREVADALARIVAVAEGQVGDGWKADPDQWDCDWDDHVDIWIMLDALGVTEQRWQTVGDRSAAWLRSLLDGAS